MNDPHYLAYLKQQNKIKMEVNRRASENRKKKRADILAQHPTPTPPKKYNKYNSEKKKIPQKLLTVQPQGTAPATPPANAFATPPVDASATPPSPAA